MNGNTPGRSPSDDRLVIGALIGVAAASLLTWAAGEASGMVAHFAVPRVPLGLAPRLVFGVLAHPGSPASAWPERYRSQIGPGWLVVLFLITGAALVGLVAIRLAGVFSTGGFGRRAEVRRNLSERAARKRSRGGGRSRSATIPLGREARSGIAVHGSTEDSYLILGPPRSGKGVHVVVPGVAAFAGPVVSTSTRPDVFTHTRRIREEMGPVYVFDPQGIARKAKPLAWSPVSGCADPLVAICRARGLAAGAGIGATVSNAEFWTGSAAAVLRCYLHAADLRGLRIADVVSWAANPTDPRPVEVLFDDPDAAPGWGEELAAQGRAEPRARDSIWAAVRRALDCFADPRVLAAASPKGPGFSAEEFLGDCGTLYVLGTTAVQASVAPLLTALVEDVTETAKRLAAESPTGRLEPPLGLWLDEAANIAPLAGLPNLVADGGGVNVTTVVVLQSLAQARRRWGTDGAVALWEAATYRLVLGGLASADDLAAISRLAGNEEVPIYSQARGAGGLTTQVHRELRPMLAPEAIRRLAPGEALLLARHVAPVKLRLEPWWKSRHARLITASLEPAMRRGRLQRLRWMIGHGRASRSRPGPTS